MVTILMMPILMYFKKKVIESQILSMTSPAKVYHVTQVDVVIWPKFGHSSISMREVIITSIS